MPRPRPAARDAGRVPVGACLLAILGGTALAQPATDPAAETGSIGGLVQVVSTPSRRLAAAGAYPGRTVGAAQDHDGSELANVIVLVQAPPTPAPPVRATIKQAGNVFSLSRAATFDLGRYPRQSRSRTFASPGLVKVSCHLHSHMSALVRVFDHPFFAIPDADGRFTISGLPPRRCDVVAWHERVGEVSLRTTVTIGQLAHLSFSLPLRDAQ